MAGRAPRRKPEHTSLSAASGRKRRHRRSQPHPPSIASTHCGTSCVAGPWRASSNQWLPWLGSILSSSVIAPAARKPIVIGTTGLEERHHYLIDDAARDIAVLQTGNTSLGVTLLAHLVREAAARLDPEYDIEILEMHHRNKVDAPSGTALLLGEAAAEGRGITLATCSERGRDGLTGARGHGRIGFASLRGGTVAGDHDVIFAGPEEMITLSHRAENRMIFARGAVRAALWLINQKPERYRMPQVLGLS